MSKITLNKKTDSRFIEGNKMIGENVISKTNSSTLITYHQPYVQLCDNQIPRKSVIPILRHNLEYSLIDLKLCKYYIIHKPNPQSVSRNSSFHLWEFYIHRLPDWVCLCANIISHIPILDC